MRRIGGFSWPEYPHDARDRHRRAAYGVVQALRAAILLAGSIPNRNTDARPVHTYGAHLRVLSTRRCPRRVVILAWCRSEEHTSELQSLMSISYAVFCLKKKQQKSNECTILTLV